MDVLKNKVLVNQDNKICLASEVLINAKIIMLYFSANWCGRALSFIPKLKKVYEEAKRRGVALEIVFVSLDNDQTNMLRHFKTQGNWWALVYGDETIWELVYRFNVTTIPSGVVMKADSKIITKTGVDELETLGINVLITWDY